MKDLTVRVTSTLHERIVGFESTWVDKYALHLLAPTVDVTPDGEPASVEPIDLGVLIMPVEQAHQLIIDVMPCGLEWTANADPPEWWHRLVAISSL